MAGNKDRRQAADSPTVPGPASMAELVLALPDQLAAGFLAARWPAQRGRHHDSLVVTAMGGSAISGGLLAGLAADTSPIPMLGCREYDLPGAVSRRSLVVAISYSGDTEETLDAFGQARARGCSMAVITSGGRLLAEATRARLPIVLVPTGLPPRAALGFLFGSLLALARAVGVWRGTRHEVAAAVGLMTRRRVAWRRRARTLARGIGDALPVVYATGRLSEPVADRWRCQLNENAKVLCHTSVLPEHNHNELVGMGAPASTRDARVFALTDSWTHPRTLRRLRQVLAITRGTYRSATIVAGEGASRLEQLMSLVMLGDLVSIELAAQRGVDPLPVSRIAELKRRMARG
jgi:glucose/mannose-6-phosphate isomerase